MDKHMNIICHNCLSSNFPGIRYVCCECDNFNLCQQCKEKSNIMHNKEHAFVQITKPVRNDIKNYKNLFRPNKIFMSSGREPFQITYEINNIGNKSLKGCYFLSIKTSNKYLKCKKEVIKDDIVAILKTVSYQTAMESIVRTDQFTGLYSAEYLYGDGKKIIKQYN